MGANTISEIKEAEQALEENSKSWDEKVADSKAKQAETQHRSQMRKTQCGDLRGNVFGGIRQVCHIVNLNEDALLNGRLKHKFPEGKLMRVGKIGTGSDEEDS